MQKHVLTLGNNKTVYVIFRVYNLGRADMGLKIYLDPETLRFDNRLSFTAETWSVVPV
jgi:hypothetical protein